MNFSLTKLPHMKNFFILALTLLSVSVFAQQTKSIPGGVRISNTDSTFKVVYVQPPHHQPVAYYINGKLIGQNILNNINPEDIEDLKVVQGNINIGDKDYNGQIYIKTKSGYAPKFISLSDLKDKYTNLKGLKAVFMIDGNILNEDYDNYIVDENYLLRIIVDKIQNPKQNIDLNLIKLLTKSEANLKKANDVIIRGTE